MIRLMGSKIHPNEKLSSLELLIFE